jgi:hypothetical protein
MAQFLRDVGMKPVIPEAGYFMIADWSPLSKFYWFLLLLFTNGGTCLFDIVHSALWGFECPVCMPDAQVLFLTVGHGCCIRNIPQYWFSPVEYRQPELPSSYQLHHLLLRPLSQVMKNPPHLGFEPGTSRTKARCSNHYTIELCFQFYWNHMFRFKYSLLMFLVGINKKG